MRPFVKWLLRPAYEAAGRLVRNSVEGVDRESHSQQMQRTIVNQYTAFRLSGVVPYPNIRDAGFRVYSQFEEDGHPLCALDDRVQDAACR
jgi:hypothetical protein